jgi:hypothetical protein
VPTYPDQFFAADARFAPAFATFLRQHPHEWRLRRIDHFCPIDSALADWRITVQGRIRPAFLEYFMASAGDLTIPDPAYDAGRELTVYLPAIRLPKRPLLNFSARDDEDHTLPVLTRFETATISGLYILLLLLRPDEVSKLDDRVSRGLHIVLASLIVQSPFGLEGRIREAAFSLPDKQCLSPDDLRKWIRMEGEFFLAGLGDPLVASLEPLLAGTGGAPLTVGDPTSELEPAPDEILARFPTIESLLLHSIRDVLKILVEFAPAWRGKTAGEDLRTRADLTTSPEKLAGEVLNLVVPGMEELRRQLPSSPEAMRELLVDLTSWTAHVVRTIHVGVPFHLKFSQSWDLRGKESKGGRLGQLINDRRREFWRVSHQYPLHLRDAPSVHVEISIPDPELRVRPDHRKDVKRKLRLGTDLVVGPVRGPVETVFGAYERVSERVIHMATSRRLEEARHLAAFDRSLKLFVPLRLGGPVFWGYIATSVAFFAATAYVGFATARHFIGAANVVPLTTVLAIGGVSVTFALWQIRGQHARPIVNRMLFPARASFYIAMCVTLLCLLALAGDWMHDKYPHFP